MTDNAERYEIVPYRPEFREDLLELQQYMWGPDRERNAAFYRWKYETNPYSSSPFIYLALYEGQVVGTRAMYVTEWEAGQPSRRFSCLLDADAVVHPDHRRRGLLERMTRATLEEVARHDFEYNINLSANPASAPMTLKVGWHIAGRLETASWHAERQGHIAARALAAKLPFLHVAYRQVRQRMPAVLAPLRGQRLPFDSLDRGHRQTHGSAGSHISVATSPRPEAMAELIDRIGSDGRIRHTRDQRFFAWRFRNPLSVYRFLFWDDGRLEGYLVLQAPAGAADDAWVHIADWEATDMQVRAELLQAAMQHSQSQELVIWSATLPDEVRALLKARGFHFLDAAAATSADLWLPIVLVRAIRPDIPPTAWRLVDRDLLNLADWDLRAIYSDNF